MFECEAACTSTFLSKKPPRKPFSKEVQEVASPLLEPPNSCQEARSPLQAAPRILLGSIQHQYSC